MSFYSGIPETCPTEHKTRRFGVCSLWYEDPALTFCSIHRTSSIGAAPAPATPDLVTNEHIATLTAARLYKRDKRVNERSGILACVSLLHYTEPAACSNTLAIFPQPPLT